MIKNDIFRNPTISPNERSIYGFLKSFNPCYTSYKAIRSGTGISGKSTISKTLLKLELKRLIKKERRPNLRSTFYTFPDKNEYLAGQETELGSVLNQDTNKNNVIKPNNKMVSSPNQASEETKIKTQEILSETLKTLGPDAGINYKEKVRPSFNPSYLGE